MTFLVFNARRSAQLRIRCAKQVLHEAAVCRATLTPPLAAWAGAAAHSSQFSLAPSSLVTSPTWPPLLICPLRSNHRQAKRHPLEVPAEVKHGELHAMKCFAASASGVTTSATTCQSGSLHRLHHVKSAAPSQAARVVAAPSAHSISTSASTAWLSPGNASSSFLIIARRACALVLRMTSIRKA